MVFISNNPDAILLQINSVWEFQVNFLSTNKHRYLILTTFPRTRSFTVFIKFVNV